MRYPSEDCVFSRSSLQRGFRGTLPLPVDSHHSSSLLWGTEGTSAPILRKVYLVPILWHSIGPILCQSVFGAGLPY